LQGKPVDDFNGLIDEKLRFREGRAQFVRAVSKGSGDLHSLGGENIFLIWFRTPWHELGGAEEITMQLAFLQQQKRVPNWLKGEEALAATLLGNFEVEVFQDCPRCLIIFRLGKPLLATSPDNFISNALQRQLVDCRIKIMEFQNIYETLSEGLKSQGHSASEITDMLRVNLFAVCTQCRHTITGEDLAELWMMGEMGFDRVFISGRDRGLLRFGKGFCPNKGCSSTEILLSWRP